jgi:hypothetical protein
MIAAVRLIAAALLAAAAAGLKIEPSRGSGGGGPSRARDGPGTVGAARADKGFGSSGTSPANNKGFGGKPSSSQQQQQQQQQQQRDPDLSHLGPEWRTFQFAPNSRVRPLPRGLDAPPVPASIARPDYAADGRPKKKGSAVPWDIEVKTPQAIEGMVRSRSSSLRGPTSSRSAATVSSNSLRSKGLAGREGAFRFYIGPERGFRVFALTSLRLLLPRAPLPLPAWGVGDCVDPYTCKVAAGRVAREVLDAAGRFVRPGVTTAQINQLVRGLLLGAGSPRPNEKDSLFEGVTLAACLLRVGTRD